MSGALGTFMSPGHLRNYGQDVCTQGDSVQINPTSIQQHAHLQPELSQCRRHETCPNQSPGHTPIIIATLLPLVWPPAPA